MSVLVQLWVNSLIAGSIYALIASGFSLIYSTNKFINFAHGAIVVSAAYFAYFMFNLMNLSFLLSVILTLAFFTMLGYCMYSFFYAPLKNKGASNSALLIASLVLLLLFENSILLIFGPNIKSYGLIKVNEGLSLFGAKITYIQLLIIITSLILFVSLFLIIKKTRFGINLRAVASNQELAMTTGLDIKKYHASSFMISSFIAGVGGILIGLEQQLQPTVGMSYAIKGIVGTIIGGIGSIHGAILGSYLLGFAENFGIWFLPPGYKDAIAYILLFIFLLFRPKGIFGRDKGVHR